MKYLTGLVCLLVQITTVVQAQRICGTADYVEQLSRSNPAVGNAMAKVSAQLSATANRVSATRDIAVNEIINIPVVIHVVYNTSVQNISVAQIQSQLTALNDDYSNLNADKINTPAVFAGVAADTKIRFCLARVDPQGRATSGIIRKYTGKEGFSADDAVKYAAQGGDDAWDCTHYLNIWVCNMGGRTLGYSSIPGGPAVTDGVVISYDVFGTTGSVRSPFDKGRTATHETGHWLGLKHIWGDAVCGSDDVDDTPSQQYYNYNCPTFPHVTNCSPDSNGDMFMNFMDFTNDACMNLFTNGQKARMRALFAKDNVRNSFLTSFACDSSLATAGPLPPTDTVPVVKQLAEIKVYPNPMQLNVVVEYIGAVKSSVAKTISIYTVTGSKIYTTAFASNKMTINVAGFAKGVYIFTVEEGAVRYTKKLVKE